MWARLRAADLQACVFDRQSLLILGPAFTEVLVVIATPPIENVSAPGFGGPAAHSVFNRQPLVIRGPALTDVVVVIAAPLSNSGHSHRRWRIPAYVLHRRSRWSCTASELLPDDRSD